MTFRFSPKQAGRNSIADLTPNWDVKVVNP